MDHAPSSLRNEKQYNQLAEDLLVQPVQKNQYHQLCALKLCGGKDQYKPQMHLVDKDG
jgi:hypothetical protein